MNFAIPNTKEQLIHYLVHNVSLGTYDKKFLNNIYENNKPLTTNQNELLDKITLRYNKQLSKKNLRALDLINLPWTRPLVISSPEFTEAHLYIKEDILFIRTPYKKDYILKLKENTYPITWDRNKRVWHTEYCTEILKYVIEETEKHFSQINYCNEIKEIIDYLYEFEKFKYWDPTLVYINNRHYLVACNEHIYKAVEDYLEKITPYTLTKLVRHGITIDNSVLKVLNEDDPSLINFSTQFHPTIEADDIQNLVRNLKYIECDLILLTNSHYFSKLLTVECTRFFEDNGITVIPMNRTLSYDTSEFKDIIKNYKCAVFLSNQMVLHTTSYDSVVNIVDKLCHIVNSKPIKIKTQYHVDI